MKPKAQVSFTFPYRWLNEDKAFLDKNLVRQFIKDWGEDHVYELGGIPAYRINITYFYREPVEVNLTKTFMQKTFRKLFPIGKCIGITTEYVQRKSKTMLPVLNMEVFF